MATTKTNKLKDLLAHLPAGTPLTSEDLALRSISPDLAVYYVRAGWLLRLARGVFLRPGETPQLYPSLRLLERKIMGLHVGGKTALDWYGVRHHVSQQETLHLYGWITANLPEWFSRYFPSEYHRKRLFHEQSCALSHVSSFEGRSNAPQVSVPERALLELLSDIGVHQPMQEARELMESTYSLRADVLSELLKNCTSVKTVRLCLQWGYELSLPWVNKLKPSQLPTGSKRPWVSRSNDGLLVLKP